jgi:hypothetical protein
MAISQGKIALFCLFLASLKTNWSLRHMEAVMKKICAAACISLLMMLLAGCSSIPSGTDRIVEIQKNGVSRLGQNVIVVGMAETKTGMSSFKLFKVYQDNNNIWVALPEGGNEPPQGVNVRVTGPLQQKEFNVIGKVLYIQADKVKME